MSLFPYAYNTIERLKPEKIIQGIIKIKYDNAEALKRDVILPIVDIMNKAIDANDPHTLEVGLDELEKLNLDIVKSKINSGYKLEIAKYYSGKITRLVENAFNRNDEDSIIEITESIKNIGNTSIRMRWSEVPPDDIARIKSNGIYKNGVGIPNKTENYDKIASEIKIVLSDACVKAIGKNWSRATKSLLTARGSILVTSHEELVLDIMYDIFQMSNEFSLLSKEDKIFSMDYFIEAIRTTVLDLINKEIHFNDWWYYTITIQQIINNSLQVVEMVECFKISRILNYITDIGIEAAKKNHILKDDLKNILVRVSNSEKCFDEPIYEIGNKGYGFAHQHKKLETVWICSCLKEIGFVYLSKKMDEPTIKIFSFLSRIENIYRLPESDGVLEVTEKIIEIIEELGFKSIEYRCEKSSREAISAPY